MNKFKLSVISVGILNALLSMQSAVACTPPPPYIWNPMAGGEARLPSISPSFAITPTGGMCPQQVFPYVVPSLTDAQILQVYGTSPPAPTPTPSATPTPTPTPTPVPTPTPALANPAWESSKVYVAGDKVSYNGKNYKARWWTQGEVPSATSAVWEELADVVGNPPGWNSATAYVAGSKVTYNGYIYSAKWWTQGEVPGGASNAWTQIGVAVPQRPALFRANGKYGTPVNGTSTMNFAWATDPFVLSAYPLVTSWQVHIDGIVVQTGTSATINTAVTSCAPNVPSCVPQYTQTGSFTVPVVRQQQMTFWLCTGTACRMTPRVSWYPGGGFGPAPTPTPTPTP